MGLTLLSAVSKFVAYNGLVQITDLAQSEVDTNIEQGGDQGRPRDVSLPYGINYISTSDWKFTWYTLRSFERRSCLRLEAQLALDPSNDAVLWHC